MPDPQEPVGQDVLEGKKGTGAIVSQASHSAREAAGVSRRLLAAVLGCTRRCGRGSSLADSRRELRARNFCAEHYWDGSLLCEAPEGPLWGKRLPSPFSAVEMEVVPQAAVAENPHPKQSRKLP